MYRKIYRLLRIVAIVSLVVAAWALSLNQIASFIESGHSAELRNAEAACVGFGAPHAVIADGKIYCYATFMGNEQIAPLDRLEAMAAKKKQ